MAVNRIALIGLSVLVLSATITMALAQNTSNPMLSGNTVNPRLSGNTVSQGSPTPVSPAPRAAGHRLCALRALDRAKSPKTLT
jgi:hypothetical protein